MSELLRSIDARTRLAGTNKLEILLFTLGVDPRTGRRETYGINVFKVREVMRAPQITRAPGMPRAVEGMVSLRGALTPIIDLAKFIGIERSEPPPIMVFTEYNGRTQGFLVEAVDTILRLDWSTMKAPPEMLLSQTGGLVTAVTELADGRLVMMMDVEKVLAETCELEDAAQFRDIPQVEIADRTVLFADDSSVARRQIAKTLEVMHVKCISTVNGRDAWDTLQRLARQAEAAKCPVEELVQVVLTDVEMPEMDGYMLTKRIKSDRRFARVPVLMHSSLSAQSNQQLGRSVGVDEYVPKFEPQKLAQTLTRLLARVPQAPAQLQNRVR